jgi:hypothetical protein
MVTGEAHEKASAQVKQRTDQTAKRRTNAFFMRLPLAQEWFTDRMRQQEADTKGAFRWTASIETGCAMCQETRELEEVSAAQIQN